MDLLLTSLAMVDIMSATPMANLSHLPHDVLVVIAKQLKKLEDFVSFRCVSKSLFAAAKDEYFEGIPCRKRTPYLMLPVRDDGNDDVRELYSLVEGESIVASVKLPKFKTKKCFESLGWLLVVEGDGSMFLLDPFPGTQIPVPHQNTYPGVMEGIDEYVFIQKMVLSARPSETSDFILMAIVGGDGHLAFWRLGDKAWNKIQTCEGRYLDVVYGGGEQFYAVGFPGIVWAVYLAGFGNNEEEDVRVITRCEHIVPAYQSMNLYILKITDDTLLIIARGAPDLSEDGLCYMTTEFEAYEVDITTGKMKVINSLGSMAVFIGENSTIAVDASTFPGEVIKANHIYFTDDDWEFYYFHSEKGGGMDIGVYNLETETIESILPGGPLFSKVSPSVWITPC